MPFDGRQNYLTDDQIKQIAPSVFASAAAPTVSDRYAYIDTSAAIEQLRKGGLEVVSVREGTKRNPDGRAFALHEVRLQKVNDEYSNLTRALGGVVPQLVIHNSHDRTKGFRFVAGLIRFICLNGMIVADGKIADVSIRHTGHGRQQQVTDAAFEVVDRFGQIVEKAAAWSQIAMDVPKQLEFAKQAIDIRGTALDISPEKVLVARRFEDKGFDLWHTFNRVQENLTRGGARGRTATGGRSSLRGITAISADISLNRKLWAAAEEFATAAA